MVHFSCGKDDAWEDCCLRSGGGYDGFRAIGRHNGALFLTASATRGCGGWALSFSVKVVVQTHPHLVGDMSGGPNSSAARVAAAFFAMLTLPHSFELITRRTIILYHQANNKRLLHPLGHCSIEEIYKNRNHIVSLIQGPSKNHDASNMVVAMGHVVHHVNFVARVGIQQQHAARR
jgi:hypothetical protein